jgi:hypothetical protein
VSPRRQGRTEDPERLFDDADRARIARRGIGLDQAVRHLELLNGPPRQADVVRPCTVGDGIDTISENDTDACLALHHRAAEAGRLCVMVPASGAASRMFRNLLACRAKAGPLGRDTVEGAGAHEKEVLAFLEGLHRFAFHDELREILASRGEDLQRLAEGGPARPVLDALLDTDGLGYADRPKGLIPFHGYPGGSRTPLEEHLVEAAAAFRDAGGACRLHLTVSEEHRDGFHDRLDQVRASYESSLETRFDVQFSVQKPSTDVLAADEQGRPVRGEDGALLFRPAGHGALLENLNEVGADLMFMKNIDNVVPDGRKEVGLHWCRLMIGRLVSVQERSFRLLDRIDDPSDEGALAEAVAFARDELHLDLPAAVDDAGASRGLLASLLDRPFRVCGMVVNTGEPGGGPFWVRDAQGRLTLQIVESAELADSQRPLFEHATHFNPVFLACALRDRHGRSHDLLRYRDEDAVIITRRSLAGREIKVLERPGLWNGGMARWNTLFVEVPPEVFNPVKTVTDLLRPEHQPSE